MRTQKDGGGAVNPPMFGARFWNAEHGGPAALARGAPSLQAYTMESANQGSMRTKLLSKDTRLLQGRLFVATER